MKFILILVAILAGMSLPVQAVLNAKMGKALGDPIYASLISFVFGAISMFIYALITKVNLGAINQAANVHWPVWLAGTMGAFYVTAVIILTPKLGAALAFSLVTAGQLGVAIILDHYGWLGMPVHIISWPRLVGILLVTVGVVIIHKF